jgi:hypothetical protein
MDVLDFGAGTDLISKRRQSRQRRATVLEAVTSVVENNDHQPNPHHHG